jgi:hypothetical protein
MTGLSNKAGPDFSFSVKKSGRDIRKKDFFQSFGPWTLWKSHAKDDKPGPLPGGVTLGKLFKLYEQISWSRKQVY